MGLTSFWVLGFGVRDLGFWENALGFYGSGFRVQVLSGFRVWCLGFRLLTFGKVEG